MSLDTSFLSIDRSFKIPIDSHTRNFTVHWNLVSELLGKNRARIRELKLTVNHQLDHRFLFRSLRFTTFTFEKLECVTIHNHIQTTVFVVRLLDNMSNLREVTVTDNLMW